MDFTITIGKKQIKRIQQGTDQQELFWEQLLSSDNHILVEARAGCGKSSSCREGMARMLDQRPAINIRYTTFGKMAADDFAKEAPAAVDVGTTHKFGNIILGKVFGSRIDKDKTFKLIQEMDAKLHYWQKRIISSLVSLGKNLLLDHKADTKLLTQQFLEIAVHYDLNLKKDRSFAEHAVKVFRQSAERTDIIDFDDMIWLPVVYQLESADPCEILFVDEVQDYNRAQHAMIPLLCPDGRVVAVGDRYQSIYGFRGADCDSIPNLERILQRTAKGLQILPLNVTFRCPKKHVQLAQVYVSDIQAHSSNRDGEIQVASWWEMLDQVQPNDRILCRKNAPLVKAALQLISMKKPCSLAGRAIGYQLINAYKSSGHAKTIPSAIENVKRWSAKEIDALIGQDNVDDVVQDIQDREAGLIAVLQACNNVNEVEKTITDLFSDKDSQGKILLSTVHRAKGAEAENVFLIQTKPFRAKADWELQQQSNVSYVAVTRSKNLLVFVSEEERE